jgi:hypothetical protein
MSAAIGHLKPAGADYDYPRYLRHRAIWMMRDGGMTATEIAIVLRLKPGYINQVLKMDRHYGLR